MGFPFAHRIHKPFVYTNSAATDISVTIRKAREALKIKPVKASNVQALKRKIAA